ncbi:MAG TPA: hypothetical protein VD838_12285 [Anaeromyxobacteraceae bacterium]|nr:hypothetical protein [Anaeromyxobacteraceae bacterium]
MASEIKPAPGGSEGSPNVVDLGAARDARRLRELEGRCRVADELNRKSLASLFGSGLLFTRQGARLGRDLLLAQQLTFRVWEILATLAGPEDAPPASRRTGHADPAEADRLARDAALLLGKIAALTARTEVVLARRR